MKKHSRISLLFILITVITGLSFKLPAPRHEWKPLFDGKTLNGWHTLPGGNWRVEDSMIVGTNEKSDPRHGMLVTDSIFTDFELSLSFFVEKGNSGLYFRVKEVGGPYGVEGLQAEIHSTEAVGGLYETGGRGWVVEPDSADVIKWNKPGTWNTLTVAAIGQSVIVHVNGYKTAEIHNDPGRRAGHIALQLHGEQDMLVSFKDIKIKAR
ncbi:MAG: DUF1080 domain-containing protein [Bacteroidota bacterium]